MLTSASKNTSDAQNVVVTDTFPAGFSEGTVTGGTVTLGTGGSFTSALGTIAAGADATILVTFTVPSSTLPGSQTNTVSVTSTTTDPDTGNNSASDTDTVNTSAHLSITRTDGVTAVTAGDGVTHSYTITVSNSGPSDAQGVSVADSFPAGFTEGTASASVGSFANNTWTV